MLVFNGICALVDVVLPLFQKYACLLYTSENIRAVRPDAPEDAMRRAAAIACVDEAVTSFPEGYDTIVGAVSYTHLDVYKRQPYGIATPKYMIRRKEKR